MRTPTYHIFVCASFRISGEPQGVCHKKSGATLMQYIEEEILDRGLDAMISSTGCLKACEKGPILVVYPQNYWFGGVDSKDVIDEILDALEDGKPAEAYLL